MYVEMMLRWWLDLVDTTPVSYVQEVSHIRSVKAGGRSIRH